MWFHWICRESRENRQVSIACLQQTSLSCDAVAWNLDWGSQFLVREQSKQDVIVPVFCFQSIQTKSFSWVPNTVAHKGVNLSSWPKNAGKKLLFTLCGREQQSWIMPVFMVPTSSNSPYVACLCKITIHFNANKLFMWCKWINVTVQISHFTL